MARLFLVLLCFCFVSCSPTFRSTLQVPSIPAVNVGGKSSAAGVELLLNPLIDARPAPTLVVHKGNNLPSQGDVAKTVEDRVREALRKYGFTFSDTAPLAVSAEVREWLATVEMGFPAEVNGKAAVYVEVRDPANKRLYSGVYSGNASQQHPNLGQDDVRETLAIAMNQALEQLFADEQLMEILSSF